MFARGAVFASYLFRTTHLFKTAAIKSTPSEEMQSEMFRLLWQHVCLHLWRHKQSLSSISQETRRTPFCKPHKASMLCDDHNYWHPCVKILCLRKAVPSVSGIMLLGEGETSPLFEQIVKLVYGKPQENWIKDVRNNEDTLQCFVAFIFLEFYLKEKNILLLCLQSSSCLKKASKGREVKSKSCYKWTEKT